jgi:hypothetical protein
MTYEIGQLVYVPFGAKSTQVARVEGFVRGSGGNRLKVRAFNATQNCWSNGLRKIEVDACGLYTGPGTTYLSKRLLNGAALPELSYPELGERC